MLSAALFLMFAPADVGPSAQEVRAVDRGRAVSGEDFLDVRAASRHPRMRRADIGCYTIRVSSEGALRRVDFIAPSRVIQRETPEGTVLEYSAPDPNCRSISFLLNARREVVRVILSRH